MPERDTAALMAGVPVRRVDEMLGLVGLADAAEKRVGTYSLGMRQRLGIAQALIGDPAALILDEPANGLDPEGIAWMRTLLRDFADHGGTVLLSSHLLHEVQATADHLVVINGGVVVAAGRMAELLASSTIIVRSPDTAALAAAMRAAGIEFVDGPGDALTVDVCGGRVTTEVLAGVARDHGVLLTELRQSETHGLEQLYFSLTGSASGPASGSSGASSQEVLALAHRSLSRPPASSRRGLPCASSRCRPGSCGSSGPRPPTPAPPLAASSPHSSWGSWRCPCSCRRAFDQTQADYLGVAAVGLSILLPVVAILTFTGEWSQRTVMTTFTQEPHRIRVVHAKLVVSVVLGVGGAVFGGVVAAAAVGVAGASGRVLAANLSAGLVASYVLYVLVNVLAAVALGVLLQNSAAAIAATFALPAAVALIATASTTVSNWIDMATTWNWILENEWSGHVAEIGVSIAFWVVAPMAAGVVRTVRRDVG